MKRVDLGGGTSLELHTGYVVTRFADGLESAAWREVSEMNLLQAQEQGYQLTSEGVYASLAEHEGLHTVTARHIWGDEDSLVLREAAGAEVDLPYWKRLYEEAVAIALQLYLNKREITPAIVWHRPYITMSARELRHKIGLV